MKAHARPWMNGLLVLALTGIPALASASALRGDGAELIYPTSGSCSAQSPAFSPDGATLLFTLYSKGYDGSGGAGGLWRIAAAGGTPAAIFTGSGAVAANGRASWSKAADRVAFAAVQSSAKFGGDIWTTKPDGSALRRVTDAAATPGHAYRRPTFAADGAAIAFEDDLDVDAARSADGVLGAIAVVSLRNGAVRRIVSDGDNRFPVWSPDGTRILFQRRTDPGREGGYRLFTVHPDGSGLAQVTGIGATVEHGESDASWSVDGRWIVESARYGSAMPCPADPGDTESKIYLVSADGGRVVQVTFDPTEKDGAPAMSPDGRWIYFESHRTSHDGESPTQIWRIANPVWQGDYSEPPCLIP